MEVEASIIRTPVKNIIRSIDSIRLGPVSKDSARVLRAKRERGAAHEGQDTTRGLSHFHTGSRYDKVDRDGVHGRWHLGFHILEYMEGEIPRRTDYLQLGRMVLRDDFYENTQELLDTINGSKKSSAGQIVVFESV